MTKLTPAEIAAAKPTDDEITAVAMGMDYAQKLNWGSKDHSDQTAIQHAKHEALRMILGVNAVAGMGPAVAKMEADRKAKADAAAKAKADADAAAAAAAAPPPTAGTGTASSTVTA